MMSNFISKFRDFSVYALVLCMIVMTSLFIHLDSKLKALSIIQINSLELFRAYSEKDTKQQKDIDKLTKQIDDLTDRIEHLDDNVDSRLTNIATLIIEHLGK